MSNKLTKYSVLKEFENSPYIDVIELSPENLQKYVNIIAEFYQSSDIGNMLLETYFSMKNNQAATNQHDI